MQHRLPVPIPNNGNGLAKPMLLNALTRLEQLRLVHPLKNHFISQFYDRNILRSFVLLNRFDSCVHTRSPHRTSFNRCLLHFKLTSFYISSFRDYLHDIPNIINLFRSRFITVTQFVCVFLSFLISSVACEIDSFSLILVQF